MASEKEKFVTDAERAKSRSFAGYLKDRALGDADFDKSTKSAGAATLGGRNPANKPALEAAGYKKGGAVKAPAKSSGKKSGFCW